MTQFVKEIDVSDDPRKLGCATSLVTQLVEETGRHVGTRTQDVQSLLGQEVKPRDGTEKGTHSS